MGFRRAGNVVIGLILALSLARTAYAQTEEVEYKKFKFDDATCDIGISYNKTPDGMDVGVSAIALGKGANFRNWSVTYMKLDIAGERIRPDSSGRFYAREESFFRVPAAVLFAAIGVMYEPPAGSSGLERGIGKAGMAIGLGLLAYQAKGDIAGEQGLFKLNKDLLDRVVEGRDKIVITLENLSEHKSETVNIGLMKGLARGEDVSSYRNMSREELGSIAEDARAEVAALENELGNYKYGVDAEYDDIERKINSLQTRRGIAYKLWLEKGSDEDVNPQ